MNKSKWVIGLGLGVCALASSGGAGYWWRWYTHERHATIAADTDSRDYRYVSLEKIIVMLRRPTGDGASHYLAMDLVFKTPIETELATRDQLPLLRSIAVKDLSSMNVETADSMTIEELTRRLNKAFVQSYAPHSAVQPFAEAMIGKLVIE